MFQVQSVLGCNWSVDSHPLSLIFTEIRKRLWDPGLNKIISVPVLKPMPSTDPDFKTRGFRLPDRSSHL